MSKRIYWVKMTEWMAFTFEEHQDLERILEKKGKVLGIDTDGSHIGEHADFQRDHDEYVEEMSLGGKRYKVR